MEAEINPTSRNRTKENKPHNAMENESKSFDIFISYSRKDSGQVLEMAGKLSEAGYTVWIDRDGIESGDAFKSVIVKAIKASRVFVFCSSKSSNASPWTVKEVNMAVYLKKTIIPVKLDATDYDDSIMFDLVGVDYVEYRGDAPAQCIQDVLRALRKHLGQPAVDVEKTKEEIQALAQDGFRLQAEQTKVWEAIAAKKKQIGEADRICPVCGTTHDIACSYCPHCAWTYLPFQPGESDAQRLEIAQKAWADNGAAGMRATAIPGRMLPEAVARLLQNMVRIEGGTFTMGGTREQGEDAFEDEKPCHKVTLSSFLVGKYPVTQEEWEAVMGGNPSHFKGGKRPVDSVSWFDCQEFIGKLNDMTGKRFRLPTEAEWEYAARGGKKGKRYKFSGGNVLKQVGWFDENSGGRSHDVGGKSPNELGLHDMSGNIWEWVQDWKGAYSPEDQTNPTGPAAGLEKVCRGGGWNREIDRARVSYRGDDQPDLHYCSLGFRLALGE